MCLGKQKMMCQVLGLLPLRWTAWKKLLSPYRSLAQPRSWQPFAELISNRKFSLSPTLLAAFQINLIFSQLLPVGWIKQKAEVKAEVRLHPRHMAQDASLPSGAETTVPEYPPHSKQFINSTSFNPHDTIFYK